MLVPRPANQIHQLTQQQLSQTPVSNNQSTQMTVSFSFHPFYLHSKCTSVWNKRTAFEWKKSENHCFVKLVTFSKSYARKQKWVLFFTAWCICIARTMPWQDVSRSVRLSVRHMLVFCLNAMPWQDVSRSVRLSVHHMLVFCLNSMQWQDVSRSVRPSVCLSVTCWYSV